MNKPKKLNESVKHICCTAYRSLFFLKTLIKGPCNKEEFNDFFKNNLFCNQELSTEMFRVMFHTLKELGCEISSTKSNHRYELLYNPFSLKLNKNEINLINNLRKNFVKNNDLELSLHTNSLINTLSLVISDENTKESLKNYNILTEIHPRLIFQLKKYCKTKDKILLEYLSGTKIIEIELEASFLKLERDRLYLWGYSYKYKDYSYIRVDKIKKIKVVSKGENKEKTPVKILYRLYDLSYIAKENEKILKKDMNSLIIEYKIENKFKAIQKFLELGNTCEIISPNNFKNEFIQTIKNIQKVYNQ